MFRQASVLCTMCFGLFRCISFKFTLLTMLQLTNHADSCLYTYKQNYGPQQMISTPHVRDWYTAR